MILKQTLQWFYDCVSTNKPKLFVLFIGMAASVFASAQLPKIGNEWMLDQAISQKRESPQKSFDTAKLIVEETNSPLIKTQALHLLGEIAKRQKKYKESEQYYRDSYETSMLLKNENLTVYSLRNISDVQRFLKKYDEALNNIEQAAEIAETNKMYSDLVSIYSVKGNIYRSSKRYEESLSAFLYAMKIIDEQDVESSKSRIYSNIATVYARLNQLRKAVEYKALALEIVEQAGNGSSVVALKHIVELSTFNRKLGEYHEGLRYALWGLSEVRDRDLPNLEQRILLNLTIIYRKLSVYDKSLKYAIDLRKSYEDHKKHKQVVTANIQIALIYDNLKQYDSAKEYYQKALDYPVEKTREKYHASASRGLASVLHKEGDLVRSLEFAQKSRSLFLKINDKAGVETADRLIGQIYASQGDLDSARRSYEMALQQSRSLGTSWSEANNLILIGKLLIPTNSNEAKEYLEKGVEISEKISAKSLIVDGYEALARIAQKSRDYKLAYEYSLLEKDVATVMDLENTSKRIADLKIINEVDEKKRKIELLKKEAKITELDLASKSAQIKLLDSKNAISSLKLEQERYVKITLIIAAVIVLVILGIISRLALRSNNRDTVSL